MPAPALRAVAAIFLRIGNLTFGGGDPTMAGLQRELVFRRGWMSAEQYGLAFSLARITPGTNVLAFCAAAGWFLRRWPGALVAVPAACLPAAAFVVWLTYAYDAWQRNPFVQAAVAGAIAAAAGMMAAGALLLVTPQWRAGARTRALAIVLSAVVLARVFSIPPIPILAGAAVLGYLWGEPEGP